MIMRWARSGGRRSAVTSVCYCLVILCSMKAGHALRAQPRSRGGHLVIRSSEPYVDHAVRPQVGDNIDAVSPGWLNASAAHIAEAATAATAARDRPAGYFEIHGRTFWNKSLGLDQLPDGMLGHQCSAARPGPHPDRTLTYTPNRR